MTRRFTRINSPATLVVLALVLLATSAGAGVIKVPSDFASLQDAIDAAVAGDVISIDGGLHRGIVVDKPLTLVGTDNVPRFEESFGMDPDPALELDGPGSGRVVLINLQLEGHVQSGTQASAPPTIFAQGFSELHILHCVVLGTQWAGGLDGNADGAPAVACSGLDHVLVEDSTVIAGDGANEVIIPLTSWDGGIAIYGSQVVTVLDSIVRGGNGADLHFDDVSFPGACPTQCSDIPAGTGGHAIAAGVVYTANSLIAGGKGATISCALGGLVCVKPGGSSVSPGTTVVSLPLGLSGGGLLEPGGTWSLAWDIPSAVGWIVWSITPMKPALIFEGPLFLAPPLHFIPVAGGGPGGTSTTVPVDPVLIGVELAVQIYDPAIGLSRPVIGGFQGQP